MFKRYVLFYFVIMCMFACEGKDKTPSPNEAMCYAPWKMVSVVYHYTYPGGNVITNDITKSVMPCLLDNVWSLNPDGSYVIFDMQYRCGLTDTFERGTWEIKDDMLHLDAVGMVPVKRTIKTLTEYQMMLIKREDSTAQLIKDVVLTYSH